MPLPDITLDDRTFEQLQAELRGRISAYTPEWTDFNDSDPGITLMQLFAYLAEMIIYRLNQVPQKNYQAFLGMVGIDLTLPAPATVELTFTLSSKTLDSGVPINAGTQVQSASSSSGGPIVFTTNDAILAVGFSLAQVQVYDGSRYTIITPDQRAPGASFAALSAQPQAGAALCLGFDGPFPTGQHRLTIHAAPPKGNVPIVQVGTDLTASSLPPVAGFWEYYVGNGAWQPLSVNSDTTNCLTQSGVLLFNAPPAGAQVAALLGALQRPGDPLLWWIRFRIDQILGNGFQTQPMLEDILINTVKATNSVVETNELLGASSGLPNQTFTLANVPVLPKDPSVKGIIEVQETLNGPFILWKEVADFTTSAPQDEVYTIDLSTGVVTFGDGINGKIPPFVSSDSSYQLTSAVPNIIATSYQWGGGSEGNVGANTITTLTTVIPYLDSVTNLRPAAGGQDQETVSDAGDRAPAILRTQNLAVTAQDFADIALQTPGAQIVRAQAIPLYNPNLSVARAVAPVGSSPVADSVPLPGVVTVVVIPHSTDPKPVPSAATMQLVANWLDTHRLITTEIYVTAPTYRKVEIQVSVIADPRSLIATVSQALNNQLLNYFNPVTGGDDGEGWDFGETIFTSETMRQILLSPGVLRIVANTLQTYVDDVLQLSDVTLGPTEIVYSLQHAITVIYS
jgi:uncharacterized phage protein gp47/JayE